MTACLAFALLLSAPDAAGFGLPGPTVPDGLGVNIHFTAPKPGEMAMLAAAGVRWVRMDLGWQGTERQKGVYDFSRYDRLFEAIQPHGIRALLILDYSNPHYDRGLSPCSDDGRAAFARWAAAAVARYRGRGVLWEMYNEPNIRFWRPEPKASDYIQLALAVGKAIRATAADELYIGPATSQIDLDFLEECFKGGLLDYWAAVSVHPYRQTGPETAHPEYRQLRRLIARYAPAGKSIPILSGEWGYSVGWRGFDEASQGRMLPRQWLTNAWCGVPLSIWYDWHDDGPDPNEPEHHFGIVRHPYLKGPAEVYEPKPAYLAAKTFCAVLGGLAFNKRLALGREDDYLLVFAQGDRLRLAAWTTGEPHEAELPTGPGRFDRLGHDGRALDPLECQDEELTLRLDDAPQYLVPRQPSELLRIAAAWQPAPAEVLRRGTAAAELSLEVVNPLDRPIALVAGGVRTEVPPQGRGTTVTRFSVTRSADPRPLRAELVIDRLGRVAQETVLLATNPLAIAPAAAEGATLAFDIANPAGEALSGWLRLTDVEGIAPALPRLPLRLAAGERQRQVAFGLAAAPSARWRYGVELVDESGVLAALPAARFALVDDFERYAAGGLDAAYRLFVDGDKKTGGSQAMQLAGGEKAALRLDYRFDEGWRFIRLAPQTNELRKIAGRPSECRFRLKGDRSGVVVRLRFVDATGQIFQPRGTKVDWDGWREIAMAMDGTNAGHWGGADDGRVHYPIRWDTLLLIDSGKRAIKPSSLELARPTLVEPAR